MVAVNPSTVWGQLAGINGAYGGIVFIDSDSTTPIIDVANLYYDQILKSLSIGFNAVPSQNRFVLDGSPSLLVEYGVVSALANSKQDATDFAQFAVSSYRGTAQVPLVNLTGDFLGRFAAFGYTGATASFQPLFTIDTYALGATANNLGGSVIMQIKGDGGVLAPVLSFASNLAAQFYGALTVAGNLVVNGTFSLLGLFSTTAVNFLVGAIVPTNGIFSDLANRLKISINSITKVTITATGVALANPLGAASGGIGLDASAAGAGTVPTADGAGGFTMTLPPGSAVPAARTIATTAPLAGGGDLSANRTLSISAHGVTAALQTQMAANSIKGNNTGGLSDELDLTVAQVVALISALTSSAADQNITGGANITTAVIATGNYTVDCGTRPLQKIANTGAFTLTAPANDGFAILQVENGVGAGAITLSGFTTPAGGNGDSLTTTNGDKFRGYIERVNGISTIFWRALQ